MPDRKPFTIQPPADLIKQNPSLKRTSQEIAQRYAQGYTVPDTDLEQIGRVLWQALAVNETAFKQAVTASDKHALSIELETTDPAILQLPWETLHHPTYGFLGRDNRFAFSRTNRQKIALPAVEQGPLRIMLFTSLPDDLGDTGRLDVEEEQAQLLESLLEHLGSGKVLLEMPDDGRFSTFQNTLNEFSPHLLVLSGHGSFHPAFLDTPAYSTFLFEDETGQGHSVKGDGLADVLDQSGIQCLLLSACQLGQNASDELSSSLMWQLSHIGIPHVIAMRESILDDAATQFSRTLANELASGQQVDIAVQSARRAITKPLEHSYKVSVGTKELSLMQWSLPTLISHGSGRSLINWDFEAKPATVLQREHILQNIKLPSRFIGRRRALRTLNDRMRSKDFKQLLITGAGGQGKTYLATKLAEDYAQDGYTVLDYPARPENNWDAFELDLMLSLTKERTEHYNNSLSKLETTEDKAHLLLNLLLQQAKGKLLVYFDNLESVQNLEDPTHPVTDATLAAWLHAAQTLQEQGLILLLTSRWKPSSWPDADHYPLSRPIYGDFLQMAYELLRQGKLNREFLSQRDRLRQLYETLHGNGRALNFFAAAIQGLSHLEEEQFLEKLITAEAEIQTDMALETIISHLDPDTRTLLNRLPVYPNPTPVEGIIKLSDGLTTDPRQLVEKLLAVSLLERLWNYDWQTFEYQLSPLVIAWLHAHGSGQPELKFYEVAADFQDFLWEFERPIFDQILRVHAAFVSAQWQNKADLLALNYIVTRLSKDGLYRTLLDDWLPSISQSSDSQTQAEAIVQIGKQYENLGYFSQALPYLKKALTIVQETKDKLGEGVTLNSISQIYYALGDYKTALIYLKQSLAIRKKIRDKSGEGVTLSNISQIYYARGDYETALTYLQRSLIIRQEIGDKSGEMANLYHISGIYSARGDYETALTLLKQVLVIVQESGDKSREGRTFNSIAGIYFARGDYETSLTYLQRSLTIQQEIGDKLGKGTTLNSISGIYSARGDYETALTYLKQSLAIQQEIGDKSGEGITLNNIATLAQSRGDYETALTYLQQSLIIRQEIGDKSGEGTTLNNISQIFRARGDYETTLTYLKRALVIRQEIGHKLGEGVTLNNMATLAQSHGDYETALAYLKQALVIRQEIGDKSGQGVTLNNMATLAADFGDLETALILLKQSLDIQQELGDTAEMCATLFNIGYIHAQNEQIQEAFSTWVTVYKIASQINLAQTLKALENLAPQVGLRRGLASWAALARHMEQRA